MIKTKDGYAKLIGTTYSGSVSRVLLSNGGDHILGNSNGNIPLNNGTVNTNLNADMLDGLHIHAGRNNEVNKIVRTDANGFLLTGWINTTSGDIGTGAINKIYCSNDNYIRYKTPANFFETLSNDGNQISITIGSQNRKLTVNYASFTKTLDKVFLPSSTSNAANTAWCKFARITFNNSAWSAASGYLFFGGGENPDNRAILVYHFRSGNTATTLSTANLYWLVKSYSNATVIAVKAADNVYDLYTNNSETYMSPCIYHMSAFSSKFTWSVGNWTTTKPTAAYTSSDIGIVNYANSAGNADTVDNYHANNLFTTLSNSNNGVSITIGGTTKSINNINVSYANSSGYANYLNSVGRMDYGWSGINYFNASLTAGCSAKVNDSPTSAWWHILRFNHGNSSGYYTDLAVPLNNNSLYWKTVRGGSVAYSSWVKVLDSLNYNEYAPTKTGGGASGTWDISITGNAHTVDGQHFNWNNNKNDHTYLWAASSNGQAYLVHRASISVNYAVSAGTSSNVVVNSSDANSTYRMVWHSGNTLYSTGGIYCNPSTDYLYASSMQTSNWFRSTGLTGWYNETYAGGWYMNDVTWIRTHNNKGIYTDIGTIYNLGHAHLACNSGYNVGIGTTSPSYKLHVVGDSYSSGYIRAASGFIKESSSNSYVLLGGGGHKAISDFSMSHSHPYLLLSGGTLTGNLTMKGDKRITFNSSYIYLDSDGYLHICPSEGLIVENDTSFEDWNVSMGSLNVLLLVYATHFYENSDIRYKRILRNLSINSNIIANLPLFDFEWIENNTIGTGTSALAVQQILPNLVSGTDKLTLDYGVLGTIAGITACKELVMLKSELLQLKEKVKLLEDKLRKYENI